MYSLKILDSSKLFFTSDLHFNHFNIAKYCNRPFNSRKEMNEALIRNWNTKVPEDGIVINCGDFSLFHEIDLKQYQKLASKLNGTQLLVRGNHDRVPLLPEGDGDKFIAIVDIANIIVDDITITASHYPLLAYPTHYNVFGHVHTLNDGIIYGPDAYIMGKINICSQKDVGVDCNNYTPISYQELMSYFNS